MKQLVQSVRSGDLRIVEGPDPLIGPTEVLVQTTCSVVSAGTERAVRKLASASLLQKAKARPDLVRQVVRRARENGVRSTLQAVQARLDEEMPLGYSGAGVVVEVGEAVARIRPGMRVATGGAGHGDLQVVAGLLTVPIPDDVTDEHAAFATVASIALHGLRLADVGPGGAVCVVGLGLIGQLTARLAKASGLRVFGVDVRDWTVERTRASGVDAATERGEATTREILGWSRGRGADAVLVTAATASSDPMRLAPARIRDRGTLVVVGDVGLDLERTPLYEKEVTLRVARSYGPGRYERSYEEWAVDYPVGHVRFTEGRNLEAALDLMAGGQLGLDDLITHRFEFERAAQAYDLLSSADAQYLGIELRYREQRPTRQPARPSTGRPRSSGRSIALIGAGNFARGVLVPAIKESGLGQIASVSSASGTTAAHLAERIGATAVSVDEAMSNPDVDLVVIATSHDTHAALVVRALEARKDVFCEKPLAITEEELDAVSEAWNASGRHLAVGLNRRHSRDVQRTRTLLAGRSGPLSLSYRVNAGRLPAQHWYNDRTKGGRLVGEVCHFVDTCDAVVGAPAQRVAAIGGDWSELIAANNLAISLEYGDGSVAVINYSSNGYPQTPKERLEVLGDGRTLVIDDYQSFSVDGKTDQAHRDKGHVGQLRAFARQLEGRAEPETLHSLRSMATTLAAVVSLGSSRFEHPFHRGTIP